MRGDILGRRIYPYAIAVHDKPAPIPGIPNTWNATPLRVVSCHHQLLLTAYYLLLTERDAGANVLAKSGRSQGPSRAVKSAHQFPDKATPVVLNG